MFVTLSKGRDYCKNLSFYVSLFNNYKVKGIRGFNFPNVHS